MSPPAHMATTKDSMSQMDGRVSRITLETIIANPLAVLESKLGIPQPEPGKGQGWATIVDRVEEIIKKHAGPRPKQKEPVQPVPERVEQTLACGKKIWASGKRPARSHKITKTRSENPRTRWSEANSTLMRVCKPRRLWKVQLPPDFTDTWAPSATDLTESRMSSFGIPTLARIKVKHGPTKTALPSPEVNARSYDPRLNKAELTLMKYPARIDNLKYHYAINPRESCRTFTSTRQRKELKKSRLSQAWTPDEMRKADERPVRSDRNHLCMQGQATECTGRDCADSDVDMGF
ncbi:hypothetical protein V8F20_007922 [Naviculisporaceae sp. PSN 640]